MGKATWTQEMIKNLIKYYPLTDTRALAKKLGKGYTAVKSKAKVLGLRKMVHSGSPWVPEKVEYLKTHYHNTTNEVIAQKLGLTEAQVSSKAFLLRLKKNKDFMLECSKKTWFPQGHVSHNKGKKQSEYMKPASIERTKKTRFKKGQIPHNTNKDGDGAISVRRDTTGRFYKYIRLAVGEWKPLHTHVWETERGPVPENHCLWFKDGNSLNCEIENLEVISRAENLNRNFHQYPEEYKAAVRALTKLKKNIKTLENGEK